MTFVPTVAHTLSARYAKGTNGTADDAALIPFVPTVSFNWQGSAEQGDDVQTEFTGSLGCTRHPAIHRDDLAVRRLTPRECERLMGWPDDHTRWAHDGTEIADSHRYKMCGNGVVAPVAEWIGRRLPMGAST